MSSFNVIINIMKADFRERVRSYKFLIILGLTVLGAFTFIAPANASYITNYVTSENTVYRGIYNSAWLGCMMALSTTVFLSLFGFYLIKNTIERDSDTGVNQILGASSLKKSHYIIGKFLSNFSVLLSITLITAFSTIVIQLIRGEILSIKLLDIFAPFLIIVIPTICIVSAIAIIFETIPFLKGSFGSVGYFLLWMAMYIIAMETNLSKDTLQYSEIFKNDVFGMTILLNAMLNGIKEVVPNITSNMIELFGAKEGLEVKTLNWQGFDWKASMLLIRFIWMMVAFLIISIAIILFRGFETKKEKRFNFKINLFNKKKKIISNKTYSNKKFTLSRLDESSLEFNLWRAIVLEMKLSLKSMKIWWFVVVAIIIGCELIAPMESVKKIIVPISMIFPISMWSTLGTKENKYNLVQILNSCPKCAIRQYLMTILSSIILTFAIESGLIVRLIISGNIIGSISLLIGIVFIPSLAMLLGTLSGNSKLFEIVYTIIWYFGIINKIDVMDYTGMFNGANISIACRYLLISIIIIIITYWVKNIKTKIC